MPRRNHSKHSHQRRRYSNANEVPRYLRPAPQIDVTKIVLPQGKCGRKLRFATEAYIVRAERMTACCTAFRAWKPVHGSPEPYPLS